MGHGWEHVEETDRYAARRRGDGLDEDPIHGPLRRGHTITAAEDRRRREEERARAARLRGLG